MLYTEGYSNKTHRLAPLYSRWSAIVQRCLNPKHTHYHRYGGRGIQLCERWQSFENFLADVGEPPFFGATIDRENNDGNYEPGNVRWATRKEQANNRANTLTPTERQKRKDTPKSRKQFVAVLREMQITAQEYDSAIE